MRLRIGDEPLAPAALVAAARGGALDVELTPAARERMVAGHRAAEEIAALRSVYGRTTGSAPTATSTSSTTSGPMRRLLRSHAGGLGEALPEDVVRATILVRLAQMAAGGGSRPEVAVALASVLADDRVPTVRDLGGLGTGDLTVLAQLGLALVGEGEDGGPPRIEVAPGDALPLMSSNAATFATAALVWADLAELLDAGIGVATLSFRLSRAIARRSRARSRPPARFRASPRCRPACARSPPAPSRPRARGPVRPPLPSAASPGRCTTRSPPCTTSWPSRSTPPPRTRSSRAARRSTTAASMPPAARWRSTACGWRSSPSAASQARGSPT